MALTFAVNAINRSMGLHDLYPFVLNAPAVAKLAFIAQRIAAADATIERGTPVAPAAIAGAVSARNTSSRNSG
jgi:hypothetical protein